VLTEVLEGIRIDLERVRGFLFSSTGEERVFLSGTCAKEMTGECDEETIRFNIDPWDGLGC
jgi:hypothetical protein